jgi:hypothetical protein
VVDLTVEEKTALEQLFPSLPPYEAMTLEAHQQALAYLSRTRSNARTTDDVIAALSSPSASIPRPLERVPVGS